MSNRKKNNFKKKITNLFGSFGYFFCSLQWVWVFLLYFSLMKSFALFLNPSPAIDSQVIEDYIIIPNIPVAANYGFDIFLIIMSIEITIFMIVLAVYVFIKLPSNVAKTSKNVVRNLAENSVPIILKIQHEKDTKKNHLKLTPRLILIMKIAIIIIPVIATIASQFLQTQMIGYSVAICISLWLFCFSFAFFGLQYFLGKLFLLKAQDIK